MLTAPMDVLREFPVRKSKQRKQEFRDQVQDYVTGLGYAFHVENGSFGSRNMVIGDPARAEYLITAHYDTCAALPFPNLITPESPVLLILWQLAILVLMLAVLFVEGLVLHTLFHNGDLTFWAGEFTLFAMLILMLVGPANRSNANDNTSGVVTVLEILKTMPENQRDKVCFLLFDLEEAGLIGSASYAKAHKAEIQNQLVLNLDCVGDGDVIRFYPTKGLKKDEKRLSRLDRCCGVFGRKSVSVRKTGFGFYPSDQKNFPLGVGICALRKNKLGLYLSRIHTRRDTVLEITNVNILRAAIITMATAVQ